MQTGSFVVSIDVELAWGEAHKQTLTRECLLKSERGIIDDLLGLVERYEIRATWAMVGHLFLTNCRPGDGVAHPEIVRPGYPWLDRDWFDRDPLSDAATSPLYYAPDYVEKIQDCPVPQEVASHGFSHMMAGDEGCSEACFESELRASRAAAEELGIDLRSFVYPRNSTGHTELLAKHGFRAFRGRTPSRFGTVPGVARTLLRGIDAVRPLAGSVVRPRETAGLWDIPATHFYGSRLRPRRSGEAHAAFRRALRRLRQASDKGGLFHLWFHPHDIAGDPGSALAGLDVLFQEVARLRDDGTVRSVTMGELAAELDGDTVGLKQKPARRAHVATNDTSKVGISL